MSHLVVSKASSEEELRGAFQDSILLNRIIESVTEDIEGNLDLDVLQETVDELVEKYGLNAEQFSIKRLQELIEA